MECVFTRRPFDDDIPGCGRAWEFADFLAGLPVVCKSCGQAIPVPAARPAAAPTDDAIQVASLDPPAASAERISSTPPPSDAIQDAARAKPGAPDEAPSPGLRSDAIQAEPRDELLPPDGVFASILMPDWAIERARASLRIGMDVPQIERRLIAHGLPPQEARAVVDRALEERIQQQVQAQRRAERRTRIHRLLCVIAGVGCIFLAHRFFGPSAATETFLAILLPAACIWFSDAMSASISEYTGRAASAGFLLRWSGWLLLLAIGGRLVWLI